jgi:predicted TIM-barrel fold metal-dependent hydrolase
VSLHSSDSGYAEQINAWEPASEYLPFKPTAFRTAMVGKRPIEDAVYALICHGALSRNPDLRILSIENGASWVAHVFDVLSDVYAKMPQEFLEDPIEAFKRCVYVAPFWEDDFAQIAEQIGIDRVIFGSDWPHPEGLKEPLSLVDHLHGLPAEGVEKIMGANMLSLLKIPQPARA